jgi:hypothetical protein
MGASINRTKFLMSYNNKIPLNENFKVFEDSSLPVITDWLSPDEKYFIFLDELYDLKNKTKLGNIWENFDRFKIFLKHSFEVTKNIPENIKESVLNSLSNNLLLESKQNYSALKPLIRQFLTERSWGEWAWDTAKDFGGWVYDRGAEAVKGISDFAVTSYEGAKKVLGHISRGEWQEVLNLISKGALYVARRLRDAMYHPIGMVLDIILVATGIGKLPQAVIWAIIVALDIYEISSGDTEEETDIYIQYLMLGIDILGLVLSGGIAGVARETFAGVRSLGELTGLVGRSSTAKTALTQMAQNASKAPTLLKSAAESLSSVFPMAGTFIKGILGSLDWVLQKFLNIISGILKPKPILTTTAGLGAIYGVENALEKGAEVIAPFFGSGESGTMASNDEFNKSLMSGEAEYKV